MVASGFLNIAWKVIPLTGRAEPARKAVATLATLMFQKTLDWTEPEKTSPGDIGIIPVKGASASEARAANRSIATASFLCAARVITLPPGLSSVCRSWGGE